jgi:hypothetical protein
MPQLSGNEPILGLNKRVQITIWSSDFKTKFIHYCFGHDIM